MSFTQRENIRNDKEIRERQRDLARERQAREERRCDRDKNNNSLDGFARNAGVGGNSCGRGWNDSK